ncbi:UvrD-helicase domain-containing protein [Dermabacteraceae bacterium P13264]
MITASAGSGKTFRLMNVIAEKIRTEGLRPDQIIATTFSRKAAQELRERINRKLLEEGRLEAAASLPAALIGTVNSVAEQILREYAIDGGLSPDLRLLPEAAQSEAFHTAVDGVCASAYRQHAALLRRTGHDAEYASPNSTVVDWRKSVQTLVNRARTNLIDAQALREQARESWRELAKLLPPAGEDMRARWLADYDACVQELRNQLRQGEVPKRSIGNVTGSLLTLEEFRRTRLATPETARWDDWARVASFSFPESKLPEAKKPGSYPQQVFTELSAEIADSLLSCPALAADLEALIGLVADTAANALELYEEHKRALGAIDFVDQEVKALGLVRKNERVREALRQRFRFLAVDEFQDTSPLQLELFLALRELIPDTVWVGDPKQSIYGFRDTDPALLNAVVQGIQDGLFSGAETETLGFSWRSSRAVVHLSNELFTPVFSQMRAENVRLQIPSDREACAGAGETEVWLTSGGGRRTTQAFCYSLAHGLKDALSRYELQPEQAAVLVRSNDRAREIAQALREIGLPASCAPLPVAKTPEGNLVLQALRALTDPADTLALTRLVVSLPEHAARENWLFQLAEHAGDTAGLLRLYEQWWEDPSLAALGELRRRANLLTPHEAVEAVVAALRLPERIATDPATTRSSLGELGRLALEYTEDNEGSNRPVTLAGFATFLENHTEISRSLPGAGRVFVGTIHQAKGLEWPLVVTDIGRSREDEYSHGLALTIPEHIDLTHPLAGRRLRYIPKLLAKFPPYLKLFLGTDLAELFTQTHRQDSRCLYYVALTRAKDVNVLVNGYPNKPSALDVLLAKPGETDPQPVVCTDAETSLAEIRIPDGPVVPAALHTYPGTSPLPEEVLPPAASAWRFTDPLPAQADFAAHAPARFTASQAPSQGVAAQVGIFAQLGEPLVAKGGQNWDLVGDATHAYLATPYAGLSAAQRTELAAQISRRWGGFVSADVIVAAGERWQAFLAAQFPGARLETEVPLSWRRGDGSLMEGWIDALLTLPDGSLVVVDHKSYPGEDPLQQVKNKYLGQLACYRQALTQTQDKPVTVLVHLPLRGLVIEVESL